MEALNSLQRISFVLLFAAAFNAAVSTPLKAAELSWLENSCLRIAVSRDSGTLMELTDVRSGHDFATPDGALWELQLLIDGGLQSVGPAQAGHMTVEPLPGSVRGHRLVWQQFSAPLPGDLVVEAVVTLAELDDSSRWQLNVRGVERATLRQVRYPILPNLSRQEGEQLAVPIWMGQLAVEPRRSLMGSDGHGRRSQWHYPGELSIQCLAFWGERAGLYLACNDTESFRKAFAVVTDGKGALGCEVIHWPESPTGTHWRLPYEVLLGTYRGDWFAAAERYRAWATNQAWATQSRLAAKSVPKWVSGTALWVWNRGRSEGVLAPAVELRRRLGLPVSVFWHWWHGCAYDAGFPEYFPPREGTDRFKRAVADARDHGVHALAYMNQRLWGMTTTSWTREGAATWAVKAEDGQIRPEIYNTFNRAPCASMCLGTEFWRAKYAGLAEQAVRQLGLSGIYMDQACLSLSCYDPAHGHPVGGGTYWVNGFRLLAHDIRRRCAIPQSEQMLTRRVPALAGEGCGEPWLSQLDLMLSLQVSRERYAAPDGWETIPFFHAVYHPYAVLFGNYSSLTMPPYDELWPAEFAPKKPLQLLDRAYSTQFRLEQARAFVWGQQPTLANFTSTQFRTRADEIEYALKLARLRHRFTGYLLQGTFLRPPRLEVAQAKIPISRLSIYAGQQGGLKSYEKQVPLAIAAAWRAPDERVAIVLASIAEQRLSVRISIPTLEYGSPAGAKIIQVDHTGRKNVGAITPGQETIMDLVLPPCAACILELGGSNP